MSRQLEELTWIIHEYQKNSLNIQDSPFTLQHKNFLTKVEQPRVVRPPLKNINLASLNTLKHFYKVCTIKNKKKRNKLIDSGDVTIASVRPSVNKFRNRLLLIFK